MTVFGLTKIDRLKKRLETITGKQWNDISAKSKDRRSKVAGTSPERRVWGFLDEYDISYMANYKIGRYEADVYLPHLGVVIEVDGDYWHSSEQVQAKDRRRDEWMSVRGYEVHRILESEVKAMSVDQFGDWLAERGIS